MLLQSRIHDAIPVSTGPSDLNEKALTALSDEIKGCEGRMITEKVDLCSQEEVQGFVDHVVDQFKTIDVLVNLVGGIIRTPSVDYPIEDWEYVMDINLKAFERFLLDRLSPFFPQAKERRSLREQQQPKPQ